MICNRAASLVLYSYCLQSTTISLGVLLSIVETDLQHTGIKIVLYVGGL